LSSPRHRKAAREAAQFPHDHAGGLAAFDALDQPTKLAVLDPLATRNVELLNDRLVEFDSLRVCETLDRVALNGGERKLSPLLPLVSLTLM
jgi:hypothetical protein